MSFDISKLKHLPKILPEGELRIFNGLVAVFVFSFLVFFIALYFSITIVVPQAGGEYTEGVIGSPRLVNPLYADNNAPDRDMVKLMYAGLVKFDGTNLSPDLAETWEISDDQKEYTFTLRPLTWPDGEPFTAADVVYTIETIQNPDYQSPLRATFSGITVSAIDDHTVAFSLPKPLTPFLESLSVGILPMHIWKQIPPQSISFTDFNFQPIGLGPYRFKKLIKDKFGTVRSYTLEHNESYHLGTPNIKEITLRFYPTINDAVAGLQKREIEGLNFLPQGLLSEAKLSSMNIHSFQLPQYTALFFNTSASSKVSDKRLRKALALAIDKEKILNEAIDNHGQIIDGPILPGYPGFHENIEKFEYNLTQAAQILDDIGWFISDNNMRENENDEQLQLTITTANTPELTSAAEVIAESWQSLGIKVDINAVDTGAIQGTVISQRKFDILLFGEIVGLDPDPYPFWHSSQISSSGLNLSNFKHPEADQVLEEARETADPQKKAQKYIHFQNILVAEIPAVFLYNPDYLYPTAAKIKGLNQERIINPSDRFATIHNWYIKTSRSFR